ESVPRELYHEEWERRRLRNRVHLTIGGCLGPCALANVIMLLFEGRQAGFHSMSKAEQILALYDWIEELVGSREWTEAPAALRPRPVSLHRLHLGSPARRRARGRPSSPSRCAGAGGLSRSAARARR